MQGEAISDQSAIIERLETALQGLEQALATREAENARLRRIEVAAAAALADLDALIGEES